MCEKKFPFSDTEARQENQRLGPGLSDALYRSLAVAFSHIGKEAHHLNRDGRKRHDDGFRYNPTQTRRDGRVAEGGGLLNRYRVKSSIGGSNPPLSARNCSAISPPVDSRLSQKFTALLSILRTSRLP